MLVVFGQVAFSNLWRCVSSAEYHCSSCLLRPVSLVTHSCLSFRTLKSSQCAPTAPKLLKYENFLTCLKYSGLLNDIVCSGCVLCRYCGNTVSHFQKEEMFKVGGVFNLIDISSGSAHHGHCYHGLMDICLQCFYFNKCISSDFPTHRSMEWRLGGI